MMGYMGDERGMLFAPFALKSRLKTSAPAYLLHIIVPHHNAQIQISLLLGILTGTCPKILSSFITMLVNDTEPSKFVTLVSNDGFEFVVLREAACVSTTIARMLSTANGGGFQEALTGICRFEELRYVLLFAFLFLFFDVDIVVERRWPDKQTVRRL